MDFTPDKIVERVKEYLPSKEVLLRYKKLNEDDIKLRQQYQLDSPGADLCVTSYSGRLLLVPPWHVLNRTPKDIKGIDYARSVFEGSSFIPQLDKIDPKKIVSGNIVLHGPRMKRLHSSLLALGYDVPTDKIAQAVYDLALILGEKVMRTSAGLPSRAYIRPRGTVGKNGWGVAARANDPVELGAIMFNWAFYFEDPIRIYQGTGLKALIFLDAQRLSPIVGKLSANYPIVGGVGKKAKDMGYDEAILLAPHGYNPKTKKREYVLAQEGKAALKKIEAGQDFADGPGEGIIAVVTKGDKKELWYPPESVNQLKSTTMAYVVEHLAPNIGFKVIEKPFGFYELKKNLIDNVIMVGNAVGLAPVGEIGVVHPTHGMSQKIKMPITAATKMLVKQYQSELDGLTKPSHQSLLTPVDIHSEDAIKARSIVYDAFANYYV